MKPPTVRHIADAIESWAPRQYAYDWDPVGLSIGNPASPVTCVITCLTITRAAFQAAREAEAEMIVSHHPLIFSPLKTLRTDVAQTKLCLDIVRAGMACYSAHTNLDVVPGGVNHILAEKLGLHNVSPLLPVKHAGQVKLVTFVPETHLAALREAVCAAGAGVIGHYSQCTFSGEGVGTFLPGEKTHPFCGEKGRLSEEPERRFETLVPKPRLGPVLQALHATHPYEEPAYDIYPVENRDAAVGLVLRGVLEEPMTLDAFADHVRQSLALDNVRMVGRDNKQVTTVAAIGGSGGGELGRLPFDLDVCVTGDVKYHDALDALERGLCVIDAGHAGTELPAVTVLADFLQARFLELRVIPYREPPFFRTIGA